MDLITVRAPQPVTEIVCGVPFREGVAQVDPGVDADRRALLYFTQAGYAIEHPVVDEEPPFEALPGAPGRSASKADWKVFWTTAAPEGLRLTEDQAEALTRDQLAERALGPKED